MQALKVSCIWPPPQLSLLVFSVTLTQVVPERVDSCKVAHDEKRSNIDGSLPADGLHPILGMRSILVWLRIKDGIRVTRDVGHFEVSHLHFFIPSCPTWHDLVGLGRLGLLLLQLSPVTDGSQFTQDPFDNCLPLQYGSNPHYAIVRFSQIHSNIFKSHLDPFI